MFGKRGVFVTVFLLLLASVVILTGCGESESEKAEEAYKEDVAELKEAVGALQDEATYESLDSLEAAFTDVRDAYDAAVESGRDVADARISEVEDAYQELRDDIQAIDSDQTLGEKIDAVTDAVNKFSEQLQQI